MAQIMLLDTIDEDLFVCGPCKIVFNCLQEFSNHKKLKCNAVLPAKLLYTEDVNWGAAPASSIPPVESAVNQRSEVFKNDLTCTTCNKKFKTMKSLLTHSKTHGETPYQCPICGRCFVQNYHMHRHINCHKVWPLASKETTPKCPEEELLCFNCSYCNLILPNYSQYRAHLKNHSSLKKFKCIQGDCMEFYETVEGLLNHVSSSHDCLIYSCHMCDSKFTCLEDIAAHGDSCKDVKRKLKVYKCSQCDAQFRKSEKLTIHMRTENHQRVCIHCQKIFTSDKRLRLHLQIHRELKPYQCDICNSSFHMKKYLSAHMRKHGNREFKCSLCNHMFKRQDLLQRHMKLHQPRKKFKCPFRETLDCQKEYSRSDKLKLHIKSHTKHMK